jgi:hypothetical protein
MCVNKLSAGYNIFAKCVTSERSSNALYTAAKNRGNTIYTSSRLKVVKNTIGISGTVLRAKAGFKICTWTESIDNGWRSAVHLREAL